MLDLKKLIKNMRTMKTLLKHSLLTPDVRMKLENIENHVIDLEPDDYDSKISDESSDTDLKPANATLNKSFFS